jgi:hypothetical protein
MAENKVLLTGVGNLLHRRPREYKPHNEMDMT